jgi:hypothetical protein
VGDDLEVRLMPSFIPKDGGALLVLDKVESELLDQLLAELRALIADGPDETDPVHHRLFPAAYEKPDDEKAYREMTSGDLEAEKVRALDTVSAALSRNSREIEITGEDFDTWLACLTDLRLAIGTRLNVDEERMGAEFDPNDPDAQALTVLHWLGWVQEGLLRAGSG